MASGLVPARLICPISDATWELMAIADLNGDGNIDSGLKTLTVH
jgi:hypothetical protein